MSKKKERRFNATFKTMFVHFLTLVSRLDDVRRKIRVNKYKEDIRFT